MDGTNCIGGGYLNPMRLDPSWKVVGAKRGSPPLLRNRTGERPLQVSGAGGLLALGLLPRWVTISNCLTITASSLTWSPNYSRRTKVKPIGVDRMTAANGFRRLDDSSWAGKYENSAPEKAFAQPWRGSC